ncbi:Uncharacterized membrane protein [Marinobacter daqiaonensis]|uniref:Uncharacterized membrane protein n=1 Tax=Marinobacter daqiaonensis TaxID=650891 RepID=A0A1I6GF63_9GAMM|nr:DUF2069 domain-containing protein [Marinobacter daqiaonensis]SFR40826.1 Uncharacterized membrane protein [Marinobacter daqiaonensis]
MLYSETAKTTRALTIALYTLVLALLVISTFWPDPVEDVSVALMLAVKLIPLLPFAWVVLRGHNRGYIWMSFVVIFYFTQAVVSAWLSEGDAIPVLMAVLTGSLFTVAMVHLKVNRP